MPLPFPDLDDRDFKQLVEQSLAQIRADLNTNWNDLSPGDPGVVLLEAFAYLTDQMIYRLNRLPRKVYTAYLRLLGLTIDPPTAAHVTLKIWHPEAVETFLPLPCGSLVSTAESGTALASERPVFTTVQAVEIPTTSISEASAVSVLAYHCERMEESLGQSNGKPGQSFQVRRPPIVARIPPEITYLQLALGVEVDPSERRDDDWTGSDGKAYRLWQEDENFAGHSASDEVFLVDRQAGLVQFAPAARHAAGQPMCTLAAVPPPGREIRIWYPHGGGEAGNVLAGKLTALVSIPHQAGLPAVALTNPEPARGGLDADSLENALVLGPQEIFSQHQAVTAHEFESIVLRPRQVSRARAITQAELWSFGTPGTVDIVLVPRLSSSKDLTLKNLLDSQDLADLSPIHTTLASHSPMGIRSHLRWARYKQVWVQAQVAYGSNEDPETIQQRIAGRINRLLSPLPTPRTQSHTDDPEGSAVLPGWPFGRQLRVSDIYNLIQAGEGSKVLVSSLELHLVHAPNQNITCLAADCFQPHTWYAGSGSRLFRSTNDGTGWELVLHHDPASPDKILSLRAGDWLPESISREETIRHVCPSPDQRGWVALSTEASVEGKLQSSLYLSLDCGESWRRLTILEQTGTVFQPGKIEELAWLLRAGRPILLLATDQGLLEIRLAFNPQGILEHPDFSPLTVLPGQPAYPVYTLTVVRSSRGSQQVVVALKGRRGVYLASGDSLAAQAPFTPLIIKQGDRPLGEDIRLLRVQERNEQTYLWAGVMAFSDQGLGCYRWQLDQNGLPINDGAWINQGWQGGSCLGVAFDGEQVYAATAWGGLLRADYDRKEPNRLLEWKNFPSQDLPHRPTQIEGASRTQTLIEPLIALEAHDGVVMAASENGIYRRSKLEPAFKDERYEKISRDTFSNLKDVITLPPDWLLLPTPHAIHASHDSGFSRESGDLGLTDLLDEESDLKPNAAEEDA